MQQQIKSLFQAERQQWFLWLPVLYASGALVYFALPFEPHIAIGIITAASLLSALFIFRKNANLYHIFFILSLVAAGFSGANIRSVAVKSPVLHKETRTINIEGKIESIGSYKRGYRVVLSNLKTTPPLKEEVPEKIRLNVLTGIGDARAGDVISVKAQLMPLPRASIKGAYDFSQYAYFQRIGATGFAFTPLAKISSGENNFASGVSNLRNVISVRLVESVGGQEGEIAKAMLIGDMGGIGRKAMDEIRDSGLAHLLSISGMHLALVCFIFFAFVRFSFALAPSIALNYPTKKWAALCAIAGSYFYLLISGGPVSAVRAFVMASLMLVAVLLDRSTTALRLVAIAAFGILLLQPESILMPGFQMSFAAVIGLISGFAYLSDNRDKGQMPGLFSRFIRYIGMMLVSSIVASLATAPFAIYHFSRNSPYGIIANLLAIPMTSAVTMPAGVLTVMLMPFHLEWLPALPLKWSLAFVAFVAEKVAALPAAGSAIPTITGAQLAICSLGFLWLALWKTKLRSAGFIFILIAVIAAFFNKTPDIIINEDGKFFAIQDENGDLLFSPGASGKYVRETWAERAGQEEVKFIGDGAKYINCDNAGCVYNKNGIRAVIAKQPIALSGECGRAGIIINLTSIKYDCTWPKNQITIYGLREKGTHSLYLDNGIFVETARGSGNRVWE